MGHLHADNGLQSNTNSSEIRQGDTVFVFLKHPRCYLGPFIVTKICPLLEEFAVIRDSYGHTYIKQLNILTLSVSDLELLRDFDPTVRDTDNIPVHVGQYVYSYGIYYRSFRVKEVHTILDPDPLGFNTTPWVVYDGGSWDYSKDVLHQWMVDPVPKKNDK